MAPVLLTRWTSYLHPMRSTVIAALILALPGMGQVDGPVGRLLNGDPNAPPPYDTAYVASYRSNLVVSALVKYQQSDVDLETDKGDDYSLSGNTMEQYGVGLNFKWLSVEATFDVPAWSDHDPALGKTTSKGLGLGFTGRRLWARGFVNKTTGYYLNDPLRWTGQDVPLTRPDLYNRTYMLSVNYALSGKRRFSQNAALFQMERQKRSAGTFVAGFSGWHTEIGADSSLIGTDIVDSLDLASGFSGLKRWMTGLTFGYTHTFSFWHKGFIHLALLPGLAYVQQDILAPGGALHGSGTAAITEMKAGAGFNGDRWYAALTTSFYYSTTAIAEQLNLATNYGHVRFALGLRLGDPGIRALQKVGL